MRRIDKLNLAKTMVFFSLVILFSGVAFDFNNDKRLINPKNDTYILSPNSNNTGTISITTTDNIPNTINSNDSKNNNSNNNSKYNKSSNENITDTNNNLRESIQNKYGINIKYGSETNGYSVSNLDVISITDNDSVNRALTSLNYNLNLYPENFFAEIRSGGYNLSIYLVKKYSVDNVTGITDSTNKNVIISIATDYQFNESIHHELYHYIENYMYSRGARYTTWNNLNPVGFSYGKENSSLSYAYTNSPDAYFVNNYAQTAAEEDRASTFEYMTADNKSSCLEKGKAIWLKAKYMCEQIDAVFNTVNQNTIEYWERFIY